MLLVNWSDEALADVDQIADYISIDNPAAADRVTDRIFETAASLPNHPYMYRAGRVPGTREAVVLPNYLIVYRVGPAEIFILNVMHASRQYPRP